MVKALSIGAGNRNGPRPDQYFQIFTMERTKVKKTILKSTLLLTMVLMNVGFGETTHPTQTQPTNTIGKPGLLIIAHGAPWPAWNEPVMKVGVKVTAELNKDPANTCVITQGLFMEFSKPTVADGIETMEKAGCDRIIVVPLLFAPSSHSHWDIPALLGIYSDPTMTEELKKEGAKLVRSKLPIILTTTLDSGTLIDDILLDNVREISTNPQEEAVFLLAHGDELTQPVWDAMAKRIVIRLCGEMKFTSGDWAFVHVGQSFNENGAPAIAKLLEEKKRVILVGCYLGMTPDKILKMSKMMSAKSPIPSPLTGKEDCIVSVKKDLCDSPQLVEWIIQTAMAAAKSLQ